MKTIQIKSIPIKSEKSIQKKKQKQKQKKRMKSMQTKKKYTTEKNVCKTKLYE